MNENTTREIMIIEFIRAHPGCLVEDAFRGVKGIMSRQTFFKTYYNLKNNKVIKTRNLNKRDKSPYLNDEDPLIIIANSLDKFEYTYFKLFDKILEEIKKPDSSIEKRVDIIAKKTKRLILPRSHYDLFNQAIFIFQKTITQYVLDISLKWQIIIKDQEYLSKILAFAFDRISKLYRRLFERIKHIDAERHLKIISDGEMVSNLIDLVIEDITYMGNNLEEMIIQLEETFELFDLKSEYHNIPFTPKQVQSKK